MLAQGREEVLINLEPKAVVTQIKLQNQTRLRVTFGEGTPAGHALADSTRRHCQMTRMATLVGISTVAKGKAQHATQWLPCSCETPSAILPPLSVGEIGVWQRSCAWAEK
jgi:hypothetical protein